MNPQSDTHSSRGHREERVIGAGKGTAAECNANRPGRRIRLHSNPFNFAQAEASLSGSASHLKHGQVASDPSPRLDTIDWCGGEVVGNRQEPHVDALCTKSVGCSPKVKDIASVVPKTDENSGTMISGFDNRVHL
jgi:hypothetical protein